MSHRFRAGGGGGAHQSWLTRGPSGYITLARWGVPTVSERGAESELAHKWAKWVHKPYHLGGSPLLQSGGQHQRLPTSRAGGYITSAPCGAPTAQVHNQRWPTSGPVGYITPAAYGVPNASKGGAQLEVPHKWARWLHKPCRIRGVAAASDRGPESEVAHKYGSWLHNPYRLGGSHRFRARGRIPGGSQVG